MRGLWKEAGIAAAHAAMGDEAVAAALAEGRAMTVDQALAYALGDSPDAAAALEQWAYHLARFHPRVLAVARAIQRVRRVDPDAEAHWQLVMADQQACCQRLAAWLAREQRLAPPWTVRTAADMLWALMSYELVEELLVDRGWSSRRYRIDLAALFKSTFLRPPGQTQPAPTGRP